VTGLEQARADAADYYLTAAQIERDRGNAGPANFLVRTANRIIAGHDDKHPFVAPAVPA
jgi:hypothetical protein